MIPDELSDKNVVKGTTGLKKTKNVARLVREDNKHSTSMKNYTNSKETDQNITKQKHK